MRALQALDRLRARAESRMLSRATIRRTTGRMTQDDDTGRQYPVWEVTHTALPVRVSNSAAGSGQTRQVTLPGGAVNLAVLTVHVPIATTNLRDGDHIEVTSGESAGLVLKLLEADWSDQKTARRLPVEAVQRPEEWDL